GLKVRSTQNGTALIVESDAAVVDDRQAAVIHGLLTASGLQPRRIFTYLANTMRNGDREVPYSLVAAIDLSTVLPDVPPTANGRDSIVLNRWAADDLRASVGDTISMDYYFWEEPGQLVTRSTSFQVTGIVPTDAGDRDLAPTYPGISDSPSLSSWDPPFPVDLRRVRPGDEEALNRYR